MVRASATIIVSVGYRRGVRDPLGVSICQELPALGLSARRIFTAQLYRLVGGMTDREVERIVRDLLVDPVTQEVHWGRGERLSVAFNGKGALSKSCGASPRQSATAKGVSLEIWLKSGVTDVVGESVMKGIRDLGISTVENVRAGTGYRFEGLKGNARLKQIAERLLVNPLIHDYRLT